MGFFQKKVCCICGEKAGLLDKKCIDGKVCKECRKKLSVWFNDYKNSDSGMLKSQMESKDRDVEYAKSLNFTKVFGEEGVVLIDEQARAFIAFPDTSSGLFKEQRNVKSIDDVIDLRPDIIRFEEVKDIKIDVAETTNEEKQTVDGERVSYNPPHMVYMYTFTLRMTVEHPYVKSMYIPLNKEAVRIQNEGRRLRTDFNDKLSDYLRGLPTIPVEEQSAVYNNESLLDVFLRTPYQMPDYSYGFKCSLRNWGDIQKYQYYLAMAREIKNTILG